MKQELVFEFDVEVRGVGTFTLPDTPAVRALRAEGLSDNEIADRLVREAEEK